MGVHKDSIIKKIYIIKANEKTETWILLQKETDIFLSFFGSFNTFLYGHH